MTSRSEVEEALRALRTLIEAEGTSESLLQQWFETHRVALEAYGFVEWIAHPKITWRGEDYVPDLLAKRADGLWEIVELKRPDTKVRKEKARRASFYQEFQTYLSQCADYQRAFSDDGARSAFNKKHGVHVQDSLDAIVVAGRRVEVDFEGVHRDLSEDRNGRTRLQTYDDVLTRLELLRATCFAQHEGLEGLSISVVVALFSQPGRPNFILDFGVDLEHDRFSIFVDEDDGLCIRALDSRGEPYRLRVPLADAGILYGIPTLVVFDLGVASDYCYLALSVNGRVIAERRLDHLVVSESVFRHYVQGSDVRGNEHSEMAIFECIIHLGILSFDGRERATAYFRDRYREELIGRGNASALRHSGNKFLYSKDHPNFIGGPEAQQVRSGKVST